MADEFLIAATKIGFNVLTETDINNYVMDSRYNTFKIIKTDLETFSLAGLTDNQVFTVPHGLSFIPFVSAFFRLSSSSSVMPINETNYVRKVVTNDTNIVFTLNNPSSVTDILVRYYCLEKI